MQKAKTFSKLINVHPMNLEEAIREDELAFLWNCFTVNTLVLKAGQIRKESSSMTILHVV